jgi:hypothetical protein
VRFNRELQSDLNRLQVLLFRGEPIGEPVFEAPGLLEGPRLRFSGFVPGRYTVWIDSAPYAPTVLRGVDLRDGENDLGQVTVSSGTTVVLKVPQRRPPPMLELSDAGHQASGHRCTSGGAAFGPRSACGLRGRQDPRARTGKAYRAASPYLDVDGTGEVQLELDLR